MNDIKLRAWDEKGKRWLHGYADNRTGCSVYGEVMVCGGWLSEVGIEGLNDVTVEQYIGLKDKTGVEIFVGDILAVDDSSDLPSGEYVVGFRDGAFEAVKVDDEQFTWCRYWSESQVVIVGNIHENPELAP